MILRRNIPFNKTEMSSRILKLESTVENLYKALPENSPLFKRWRFGNHVFIVCKYAGFLAKENSANIDYCEAGALLHDIADVVMERNYVDFEDQSLKMAESLLLKTGFSQKETDFILDEVIKPHDCRTVKPTSLEGKILATADAMAHLTTNIYPFYCWQRWNSVDYDSFRLWVINKIERDYNKKIFFEDIKLSIKPQYEALKSVFGA